MTRASILLAAYNAEAFIEQAIESALGQTEARIEVIVVDDGSSDGTARRVSRICRQDDRLRLVRLERNRGVSAARNAGLEAATGDWITTLDADDWYAPERVERLLSAATSARVDVLADNRYQLYSDLPGVCAPHLPLEGPEASFIPSAEVVRRAGVGVVGSLDSLYGFYRTAFLRAHGLRFQEEMRVAGDNHFLFRCLDKTPGMVVLREPTYYRRVRRDSLSFGASLDTRRHSLSFFKEIAAGDWLTPGLQPAVQDYARRMEQDIRVRTIGRPLKRGRFLAGLAAALRDPTAAGLLVRRVVLKGDAAGVAR